MSSNSIYLPLYHKLCNEGKKNLQFYCKGSNLHKHHIIPKHMGGSDDPTNLTYLTIKNHKLAHWMLWKIYKNPNDLRSMHMLGANLSTHYRKLIGLFCRDNNIGIFSLSQEERNKFVLDYWDNIRKNGNLPTEFGWQTANKDLVKQWQIDGGKAAGELSKKNKTGIFGLSKEESLKNSSKGGKLSKIWEYKYITNGVENSRAKEIPDGWWEGWTISDEQISKRLKSIKLHYHNKFCKLISINGGEIYFDNYDKLNNYLKENIDCVYKVRISGKDAYPLTKNGIKIHIFSEEFSYTTYRNFIEDGWVAIHINNKTKSNVIDDTKRYTYIEKFGYRLACPEEKIREFLEDGWLYSTTGNYCKVEYIISNTDYILNIKTINLPHFLDFGWKPTPKKNMTNPPTCGAFLYHKLAEKSIKVSFEDIPKFYDLGFIVQAKDKKERSRIQKSINQYHQSFLI